jgi:hypothetical protein
VARFTGDKNGGEVADKRSKRGPFIGERRGKEGHAVMCTLSHASVQAEAGRDAPQRWPCGSGRASSGRKAGGLGGALVDSSCLGSARGRWWQHRALHASHWQAAWPEHRGGAAVAACSRRRQRAEVGDVLQPVGLG